MSKGSFNGVCTLGCVKVTFWVEFSEASRKTFDPFHKMLQRYMPYDSSMTSTFAINIATLIWL